MNYKLTFKTGDIEYVNFATMVTWMHLHPHKVASVYLIDTIRGIAVELF